MKTLDDYLDDAKKTTGSDYKTAEALGVSRQYISAARGDKEGNFSTDAARKLAELLGVNPLEIIAATEAKRATPEAKKAWAKWQAEARKMSVLVMIIMSILASLATVPHNVSAKSMYIMLNHVRRWQMWLARLLSSPTNELRYMPEKRAAIEHAYLRK